MFLFVLNYTRSQIQSRVIFTSLLALTFSLFLALNSAASEEWRVCHKAGLFFHGYSSKSKQKTLLLPTNLIFKQFISSDKVHGSNLGFTEVSGNVTITITLPLL